MPDYREREPAVFTGLATVLVVLWLGFLLHRSPTFPGSLIGHSLGIAGAMLMLVPLLYLVIKRVPRVRKAVTRRWSMRTLLAWHIYAGILGPILVLLHTGHRFESPLGITLTAATLIVALSGFIGRFLMKRVHTGIRELADTLEQLHVQGDVVSAALARARAAGTSLEAQGALAALKTTFFEADGADAPARHLVRRAVRIAESQADVEYALATHGLAKRVFSRWLKLHIVISFALYVLMGLHIWAAIHFGLRWWV